MRAVVLAGALAALLAGCVAEPAPLAALPPACPLGPSVQPFAQRDLNEVSGLARSGLVPCLLWAHEDSGAPPVLHATDAQGRYLGKVYVPAPAVDWEDIASFGRDGVPWLMVADIGNNGAWRASGALIFVTEPSLEQARASATLPASVVRVVTVRYPDKPFNAEGAAVDVAADEVLIVSKGEGQALYALNLSAALRDGEGTLQFRARIPAAPGEASRSFVDALSGRSPGAATALDLRADGLGLALLSYREALLWERSEGQTWAAALQGPPRAVQVPAAGAKQMEALAYGEDGAWLFVGAEEGEPNSMLSVLPLR